MALTLDKGRIGGTYRVRSFGDMPEATARRLESLGMTPGVKVDVLNNKSRGTVVVRLRETRWALGRTISSCIDVDEAAPDPHETGTGHRLQPQAARCQIGAHGMDSVLSKPQTPKVGR